ncbi:MAG TPA: AMP-binding protein [Aquihabitans sp.]|nr:AMP-binding protein [Aquihabitans sp.]
MTAVLAPVLALRGETAPAVIDERGVTSWGALDERVTRLVRALRARGLEVGDTVVAMLGNQVELVEVSLACAHGGWALVPVNWHWVARELAYVLDDAGAAALIVDERWLPVAVDALAQAEVPGLRARLLVRRELARDEGGEGFEDLDGAIAEERSAELEDPQRGGPMFYTSGTTGWPKGVRSTLTATGGPPEVLTLIAHSMAPTLGVPVDEAHERVQLVCGPMYHSAQWVFAIAPLVCGATLVLQQRFDAAAVLDAIERHGVTNTHLVPTQFVRLLDLPEEVRAAADTSSLVQVMHGAAPCAPAVKRAMVEWWGPKITEYYGGTEGGFLSLITASEWLERPGSVGKPLEVVEVAIIGPDGERQPPGEPGEIWFRSLLGSDFEYHNAPDKTASAHREGGFGTLGDVGYLDVDGYLFLSDRKIDMVVSGGVNIYPAEVEHALAEHAAIADVAVFGVPNDEMGESVHAAVALRSGVAWSDDLQAELDAFCRDRLAGYKRPRSWEVHDELPRSEAGKLTKRVLRDPWWADVDRTI